MRLHGQVPIDQIRGLPKSASTPSRLNAPGPVTLLERTFPIDDETFGAGSFGGGLGSPGLAPEIVRYALPTEGRRDGDHFSGRKTGHGYESKSSIAEENEDRGGDRGGNVTDGEWSVSSLNKARSGRPTNNSRPRTRSETVHIEPEQNRSPEKMAQLPAHLSQQKPQHAEILSSYPFISSKPTKFPTISRTNIAPPPPDLQSSSGPTSYPTTRQARSRKFSWEVNKGVQDGKEFLGFGSESELGRVRLRETDGDLGADQNWVENDVRLASSYVLGYEKSVLKM